jgi:hypothetical protein
MEGQGEWPTKILQHQVRCFVSCCFLFCLLAWRHCMLSICKYDRCNGIARKCRVRRSASDKMALGYEHASDGRSHPQPRKVVTLVSSAVPSAWSGYGMYWVGMGWNNYVMIINFYDTLVVPQTNPVHHRPGLLLICSCTYRFHSSLMLYLHHVQEHSR